MTLSRWVRRRLRRLGVRDTRVLVAVSGGLDSTVLLHLLARAAAPLRLELVVAHVDHGIHPDSASVASGVAATARALGLPAASASLGLGAATSETVARRARYDALETLRVEHGARCILLAHHADDQAETVLMRMLAGSGPAGLAAMAPRAGVLVRPLLRVPRAVLERYARRHRLTWWDDPANHDVRHERSWLRTDLLPHLEARLPRVRERLQATAILARDDRAAWDALLEHLPGLAPSVEPHGWSMREAPLLALPAPLQRALLRALGRRAGATIGRAAMARVVRLLHSARSAGRADVGGGWSVERSRGRLVLFRSEAPPARAALHGEAGTLRWGPWAVAWRRDVAGTVARRGETTWLADGVPAIASWAPGDRLAPLAGTGHRKLSDLFQEAGVPRSTRAAWPVLYDEAGVLWVPSVCRSSRSVPEPGRLALRVDVRLG